MRKYIVTYHYDGWAKYSVAHVNKLYAMLRRTMSCDFTFRVYTDQPGADYTPGMEKVPLTPEHVALGRCYTRLPLWADGTFTYGARIMLLDLDCVVVGDLAPLFDRPNPAVLWQDPLAAKGQRQFMYNGGLVVMDCMAHPDVWNEFPGAASLPPLPWIGSDQAWYAHYFGPNMPVFTAADGVLSYKFDHVRENGLPPGARVVMFHGKPKPWQVLDPWVYEHWEI